ncbi:MAG TPA: hypothetical protein VGF08_09445, partial [Terriglobales bacterium]
EPVLREAEGSRSMTSAARQPPQNSTTTPSVGVIGRVRRVKGDREYRGSQHQGCRKLHNGELAAMADSTLDSPSRPA